MKKTVMAILCLLTAAVIMTGCGQKGGEGSAAQEAQALRRELSGTWDQVAEDGIPSLPEMGIPSGYIFYLDGTGVDTFWDMTFVYTANGEKLHIAYDDSLGEDWDYNYEIEGDLLTLTRVDEDAVTMVYQRRAEEEPESVPTP